MEAPYLGIPKIIFSQNPTILRIRASPVKSDTTPVLSSSSSSSCCLLSRESSPFHRRPRAFFLALLRLHPYSRGAPAAPPHPTTFSAAHGSDQPCVLPPPQRSRVRLPACRPPERRHQEPSSIAATPPGAACPGARAALV